MKIFGISDIGINKTYNNRNFVPQFKGEKPLKKVLKLDTVEILDKPVVSDDTSSSLLSTVPKTNIERTAVSLKVSSAVKAQKVKFSNVNYNIKLQKKMDIIKNNKMLTSEVLYFLQPDKNNNYTPAQARIIDAAFEKLVFFKEISVELSAEAENYGEKILNHYKTVFGGDSEYGQYLVLRKKDEVSVCNKLIKEFKNEHLKNEIHNIFSKKLYGKQYALLDKVEKDLVLLSIKDGDVKLDAKDYKTIENAFKTNPKEALAQKLYMKPYQKLGNEEKKKISEKIYENDTKLVDRATKMQARKEAIDWVKDLVGIRLVLPTGSRSELQKVERYIDKAINNGDMNITRFSNYHGSGILPYIKRAKVLLWKEQLPGMILIENSQARKKNGYTTTQMNLDYPVEGRRRPVFVEFQLRTKALNEIGNREHLIYDILEDKDITKGIPELETFYDSIGIKDAVLTLFNDSSLEAKYTDYERAYYNYLRNEETEKRPHISKPLLTEYGLGKYEHLLSFEALDGINQKANLIRQKYGRVNNLPKKERLEDLRKLI